MRVSRVLVVDGRSTDRTVEVAKNLGAEIYVQDGLGKGDAVAKAIAHIDPAVDYVVLTDADYTYPAAYIPEMIRILENTPKLEWSAVTDLMVTKKRPRQAVFFI